MFKKLQFVACTRAAGNAVVNGNDVSLDLSTPGQSLIHENQAYLVVSPSEREPRLEDVLVANSVAAILASVLQVEQASDFARLASARSSQDREMLLKLIVGHDASEALRKAKDALQTADTGEQELGSVNFEQLRAADEHRCHEELRVAPATEQPQETVPGGGTVKPGVPPEVAVKEMIPEPSPPKRRIAQRVHAKRSSGDQIVHTRRVTDGNRCEELAERFEESQGRFPLLVSSLQGTESFGCDLVSFGSAAERDQFQREHGKPLNLVKRFIEVKGRSSSRGSVSLVGNEKNAAKTYKDRYHIYRVYEVEVGRKWQVVELADPLAYDWEVTYDVDLLRRPEARYWAVEPVVPQVYGEIATP